jgi:hypothetical protein
MEVVVPIGLERDRAPMIVRGSLSAGDCVIGDDEIWT